MISIPTKKTEMKPLKLGPVTPILKKNEHPMKLGNMLPSEWDFLYGEEDFEAEINNFFNHHDFPMIANCRSVFSLSSNDNIIDLVKQLLNSAPSLRIPAASKILYYAMGEYNDTQEIPVLLEKIRKNNTILGSVNAFSTVYKALRVMLYHFITLEIKPSMEHINLVLDSILLEITIYQTILYMLIISNSNSEQFLSQIEIETPFLPSYLSTMLGKLADGNRQHFPIKKHILLLMKVNMLFVGSDKDLIMVKNQSRLFQHLQTDSDLIVKSSEYECKLHQLMLLHKYPTLDLYDKKLDFEIDIEKHDYDQLSNYYSNPITSTENLTLQNQLEIAKSKIMIPPSSNVPFPWIPLPLKEANDMLKKYLYQHYDGISSEMVRPLRRIAFLIESMREDIVNHMGILVRLLFYLNIALPSNDQNDEFKSNTAYNQILELDLLDQSRHKDIVTHAITKTILLYLKAAKRYQFERMCQILSDSNTPILILKMLSSWFISPSQNKRKVSAPDGFDEECGNQWLSDNPKESRLHILEFIKPNTTPKSQATNVKKSNPQSFATTINLLRILQKLTKNKSHRILSMVQWKSSAVLKRLLKVNNQDLKLYALKLLKCQIPFLGKKWRANNINVISEIYLNVRHRLKENYLSGEGEVAPTEALRQLQVLKDKIHAYVEKVKPKPIESVEDFTELDLHFMDNYEEWLQHEVFENEEQRGPEDSFHSSDLETAVFGRVNEDLIIEDIQSIELDDDEIDVEKDSLNEFTEMWPNGFVG